MFLCGLFMIYLLIINLIENNDLSEIFRIPIDNWIYRILFLIFAIICFYEYYIGNWGKSQEK